MLRSALFIRHLLEYAMVIPGTILFFLPLWRRIRTDARILITAVSVLEGIFIFTGAGVSAWTCIPTNWILLPALMLFLFIVRPWFDLDLPRILYAFCHGFYVCAWTTCFTAYLFAPLEAHNREPAFLPVTGAACLACAFFQVLLFWKLLSVKIPFLYELPVLNSFWNYFFIVPLVVSVFFYWVMPLEPANLLHGRTHLISCLFWIAVMVTIYFLLHIFAYVAEKLEMEQRLSMENQVLTAQKFRYSQLMELVRQTRRDRHDIRQHMRVLMTLAAENRIEDLRNYLSEYAATFDFSPAFYCANPAVDAIAAYYAGEAKEKEITLIWDVSLPEKLPLEDNELCVVIGNLLENAAKAVKKLDPPDRIVRASVRMIGDATIGISVRNRYEGKIQMGSAGLPVSLAPGGMGIGLASVSYAVKKNRGTMAIDTADGWFTVDILINIMEE